MKNVKTLIVVALMGASLFASADRVAALGGAGFWAEDYANIASFPADVNNHSVAWTNGSDFTSIFNADGTTWGFSGGTGNDVVNMMWGNGNLGVTFGLDMKAAVECEAGDVDCSASDADSNFDIGFGMPLMGMDFGFTTNTTDHHINLRRAQDLWLFDNMLIDVDLMGAVECEAGDVDCSAADANMGVGADFYTNTSYDSGTNGLFALGFDYSNVGDGSLNMNWTFAVESAMTSYATLRVAYVHRYDLMNQVGADGDGDGLVMGLGFNYGSFNLDMNFTAYDDLFTNPVNYIAGRNTDALGSMWTISYAW